MHTRKIAACLSLLVFIAACCVLCGPSRGKQVRILKQKIPEVIEFVENNGDFLQALLNAKERLNSINDANHNENSSIDFIIDYQITIYMDEVSDYSRGRIESTDVKNMLFTPEEQQLVDMVLMKNQKINGVSCVTISENEIMFDYIDYHNTQLLLKNPAIVIDDPKVYTSAWIQFTVPINDNWCILFFNGK